jgi:hypothetical protein
MHGTTHVGENATRGDNTSRNANGGVSTVEPGMGILQANHQRV